MPRVGAALPLFLACLPQLAGAFASGRAFLTRRADTTFSLSATSSRHALEFPEEAESSEATRGVSSEALRRMSKTRRRRLDEEQVQRSRFVSGDALQQLRREILSLSQELQVCRDQGNEQRVQELEQAIWHAQQVDAEYVYQVSLQRARVAEDSGLKAEAHEYRREASRARKSLPQFNLHGLWVGKYGDQGFEMINVTYSGDVLIAYKVTGDQNVPKGEVSFSVDLGARASASMLEPIELTDDAADQWGSKFLPRFSGKGQVAGHGFVNSQWLEGQMILVNQYFSFAWLPIGHQVFFGRPSPELTLKLLRESTTKPQNLEQERDFLLRCMEETEMLDDEMEVNDGIFQSHDQEYYYGLEGCFE